MKKIPYEYVLYFLQLSLISFFMLIVLGYSLQGEESDFLQRGMISQNAQGVAVSSYSIEDDAVLELPRQQGVVVTRHLIEDIKYIVRAFYGSDVFNFANLIANGRFIETHDFEEKQPVAVIGAKLLERTIEEDGRHYFGHGQQKYEVVGVFKNTNSDLDYAAYLNLPYFLEHEDPEGQYFIDGQDGHLVKGVLAEWERIVSEQFTLSPIKFRESFRISIATRTEVILVFSILAVFAHLIITTIFFVTRNKYKVAVLKLCGMDRKDLFFLFGKDIFLLHLLAFLSVFVLMFIFEYVSPFDGISEYIKGVHYHALGMGMTFLSVAITALIVHLASGVNISSTLKGR